MPFQMKPRFRLARSSYKKSYSKSAAASKIQKAWRARKKPSRLRVSNTRTAVTRAVNATLNNFSENKFCGYRSSCNKPDSKPIGTQPMSYMFFNTGQEITSLPEFNHMDLYKFPLGDHNYERHGQYMYLKKTSLTMEIQMLPETIVNEVPTGYQPDVQFRFMVIKANRKFDKLYKTKNPGDSLFLTPFNNEYGYNDPVLNPFEYNNAIINKKNWLVYRDWKFSLSVPSLAYMPDPNEPAGILQNARSRLPTRKVINISLPIWKKTHFKNDPDVPELNVPDNLDTQWLIIVQATRGSPCASESTPPDNFRMNMFGTTTARDN